jgi:hypothetical protein
LLKPSQKFKEAKMGERRVYLVTAELYAKLDNLLLRIAKAPKVRPFLGLDKPRLADLLVDFRSIPFMDIKETVGEQKIRDSS